MEQPGYGLSDRLTALETALAYERQLTHRELGHLSRRLMQVERGDYLPRLPPSGLTGQVSTETWAKIICALLLPPLVLLLTGSLEWAMRAARLVAM